MTIFLSFVFYCFILNEIILFFTGISFDQMATEIENNAHQLLKRIDKIKYSILTMNPSIECPDLSNNLKEPGNVTLYAQKITNRHPNIIKDTKSKYICYDVYDKK